MSGVINPTQVSINALPVVLLWLLAAPVGDLFEFESEIGIYTIIHSWTNVYLTWLSLFSQLSEPWGGGRATATATTRHSECAPDLVVRRYIYLCANESQLIALPFFIWHNQKERMNATAHSSFSSSSPAIHYIVLARSRNLDSLLRRTTTAAGTEDAN